MLLPGIMLIRGISLWMWTPYKNVEQKSSSIRSAIKKITKFVEYTDRLYTVPHGKSHSDS